MFPALPTCCCSGVGPSLQQLPHSQQSCLERTNFYSYLLDFCPALPEPPPGGCSDPHRARLRRGGRLAAPAPSPFPPSLSSRGNLRRE